MPLPQRFPSGSRDPSPSSTPAQTQTHDTRHGGTAVLWDQAENATDQITLPETDSAMDEVPYWPAPDPFSWPEDEPAAALPAEPLLPSSPVSRSDVMVQAALVSVAADPAPSTMPGKTALIGGNEIVENAQSLLGIPYLWGGNSDTGMDCSAFVSRAWGVSRHTTDSLYLVASPISKDELRPGDALNLTRGEDPRGYGHVRLFAAWANVEQTRMWVYEETPPRSVYHVIAYDPRYTPMRRSDFRPASDAPVIPAPAPAPPPVRVASRPGGEAQASPASGSASSSSQRPPTPRPRSQPTAKPVPVRTPAADAIPKAAKDRHSEEDGPSRAGSAVGSSPTAAVSGTNTATRTATPARTATPKRTATPTRTATPATPAPSPTVAQPTPTARPAATPTVPAPSPTTARPSPTAQPARSPQATASPTPTPAPKAQPAQPDHSQGGTKRGDKRGGDRRHGNG